MFRFLLFRFKNTAFANAWQRQHLQCSFDDFLGFQFLVRAVLFEIANLVRDRKITPLHFPPFKVSCDIKSVWSVFDILKHFFVNSLNANKET